MASLAYQQITDLSSSVGIVVPDLNAGGVKQPRPAGCWLQAESQNVRYRDDGGAPTGSVGLILYAGDPPTWFEGDLAAARFIETAASAKLNIGWP